jgi:hypothetical protein
VMLDAWLGRERRAACHHLPENVAKYSSRRRLSAQ